MSTEQAPMTTLEKLEAFRKAHRPVVATPKCSLADALHEAEDVLGRPLTPDEQDLVAQMQGNGATKGEIVKEVETVNIARLMAPEPEDHAYLPDRSGKVAVEFKPGQFDK